MHTTRRFLKACLLLLDLLRRCHSLLNSLIGFFLSLVVQLSRVTALESAFHFRTRQKFLSESYRVLKPGGVLAMADIVLRPSEAPSKLVVNLILVTPKGVTSFHGWSTLCLLMSDLPSGLFPWKTFLTILLSMCTI